jgi:8-oxo-dGTP pyrophosphatase MutT (NUDIX family)
MSAPDPKPVAQPAATPRLAATLILLRDDDNGLEVMLVERTGTASFAAGKFVFPGGTVDAADAGLATSDAADAVLRVAAIRETWEECGLLLAEGTVPPVSPGADFGALVRDAGLRLSVDALLPFAHWITPPHAPKRFDTHFFVAPAPHGQTACADRGEVVSAVWSRPSAIVEAAESERINLMFATYMNLRWLARHASAADALAAARHRPIVAVTAEPVEAAEGRTFRIPEAAGYGETHVLERRFRRV